MTKQIIAAVVSVVLAFFAWLIPVIGFFAGALISGGPLEGANPEDTGGLFSTSMLIGGAAGVCSFAALVYLRLHYGTIVLIWVSVGFMAIALPAVMKIGAAILGILTAILLAGAVSFGLLRMINWVYAPNELNPTGEI